MPRVTKSVTAKAKHKKVLSATKGHYGARSSFLKQQSNLTLNFQYAFRDRKIGKDHSGHYGSLELMPVQEN